MSLRKLAWYGDAVLAELQGQGVTYTPLIASCYGRRSRVLSNLLRAAAMRAARTRDGATAAGLFRRWQRAIACELWRRAADMLRRCLPRPADVAEATGASEVVVVD